MNAKKEHIGRAVTAKTLPGTVYDFLNGCNGIIIGIKGAYYHVVVCTQQMTNDSSGNPLAQFTYALNIDEIELYEK